MDQLRFPVERSWEIIDFRKKLSTVTAYSPISVIFI